MFSEQPLQFLSPVLRWPWHLVFPGGCDYVTDSTRVAYHVLDRMPLRYPIQTANYNSVEVSRTGQPVLILHPQLPALKNVY
jgi:hypothetical protein